MSSRELQSVCFKTLPADVESYKHKIGGMGPLPLSPPGYAYDCHISSFLAIDEINFKYDSSSINSSRLLDVINHLA